MSVMICSADVGAVDPVKYKPKTVPVLHVPLHNSFLLYVTTMLIYVIVGSELAHGN
jgi:hypothetical protein